MMRVFRSAIRFVVCVLFLSASTGALAQQGPPILESVTERGDGVAHLEWSNRADTPAQFLGFAWDIYTGQWVSLGWKNTLWYPFEKDKTSDQMNLGHSGGYHVWIANQYSDGGFHVGAAAWTGVLQRGKPHTPTQIQITGLGNKTVRLEWKPEIYGTWLYWVIVKNHDTGEWTTTQGPLGESLWHYVAYGTDEFSKGEMELTLPAFGAYWYFVAGMAWDGQTWGDFGLGHTGMAMTETIMLPGDVPLELGRIFAGSFEMGSPDTERSREENEGPVHTVAIADDFYMGRFEVTQAQWIAIRGSWPGAPDSSYGVGDDYPVYFVSWNDITGPGGFLETLNHHISSTGQSGEGLRLPTEAEWEYACRAGAQTRFFFGDSLSVNDDSADGPAGTLPGNRSDYMWFSGNNNPNGSKAVGTKLPNPFGLYDMSGNVSEWCEDWYHSDYTDAPSDGSSWTSPTGSQRIIRGGAWSPYVRNCRSARRGFAAPGDSFPTVGFRLVWTHNGYGTITIPDKPNSSSWSLEGPIGFATISDTEGLTIADVPTGEYTLTRYYSGFISKITQTKTLGTGGTISFTI